MQIKKNRTQDGEQVHNDQENFYFRPRNKVMPQRTQHLLFIIFEMYNHLIALIFTRIYSYDHPAGYKTENQPKLFHNSTLGLQCTKKRSD